MNNDDQQIRVVRLNWVAHLRNEQQGATTQQSAHTYLQDFFFAVAEFHNGVDQAILKYEVLGSVTVIQNTVAQEIRQMDHGVLGTWITAWKMWNFVAK